MDRLQKKCAILSAGLHLLLASILVIGPAFLSRRSKADDMPILDFIPLKTVDAMVSGGGNPKAALPPAAPPAPAPPVAQTPPPPAQKVREPDPPKETVKEEESSLEPASEHKRKPQINPRLVSRKRDTRPETKARADEQAREARELADARRRAAERLSQAADHIGNDLSGTTTIKLDHGPGGGGVPYANFLQAVKSIYERAWVVPDGVTEDEATAVATVTIARDSTVVSARIIRSSGSPAVDRSVQVTLDRVRYAAPLPDDAKEDQRTVTINFNVKAKRSLG